MRRYSTSLTRTNCQRPVSHQVRDYIEWLTAKPGRRAYAFPATLKTKGVGDRAYIRSELRYAELRGVPVIEVDPSDYLGEAPIAEPVAATSSEKIAEFIDPTGALRANGLLVVEVVGDREAA